MKEAAMEGSMLNNDTQYQNGGCNVCVQRMTFQNGPMAAMLEIMRTIVDSVDYKEKFRIVLEYDPDNSPVEMLIFKESGEYDRLKCP